MTRRLLPVLAAGALALSAPGTAALAAPASTPSPSSTGSPTVGPSSSGGPAQAPTATGSPPSAEQEAPGATASSSPSGAASASQAPAGGESSAEAPATGEPTTSAEPTPAPRRSTSRLAAPVAPLAIPVPTPTSSVVTVKVGADRSGVDGVTPLPGVVLGFFDAATGGTAAYTCTADADGDCSITVPNTGGGGANRDRRFYVRQVSAPSGWTVNTSLRTGNADGSGSQADPYVFQTGTQLRGGTTYSSTNQFMVGSGSTNRVASGGVWQQSRVNPTPPAQCGLDVALLLDLSGSVGAAVPNLRAAANTLVNSLVGTPSRMSLYSFSTVSPAVNATQNYPSLTSVSTQAQADVFKARYATWTASGGTNWDRGLAAVAAGETPDVAVVITDGNPSFYSEPAEGPGSFTRFREVENGVFSANAIKAKGTRVIAAGVGAGVDDPATGVNLRAISGPTLNSDYFQSPTYEAAAQALRALALGNCTGSVSVVKQIVPSGNTGENVTGATPAGGGWAFDGTTATSGIGGLPATRTTTGDGTGSVNFPLTFPGGTTSASVTIRERQQSGFTLVTQAGNNAVCRNLLDGSTVAVTNDSAVGQPGFRITAPSTAAVSCTIYNRAPVPPASVQVDKTWVINGTTYLDGRQPGGFQAQLSLTGPGAAGATEEGWGDVRGGFSAGDRTTVSETVRLPSDLCTVTSSRVTTANGVAVSAALPYTATLVAGANTYRVTNAVTCRSLLSLAKSVEGGPAVPQSWTLRAIAPTGALAGPVGASGSVGATNVEVTPNVTYQLAESGGDPRYAQVDRRTDLQANPLSTGSMSCVEVTAAGAVIPGFSDGLNGGVNVPLGARVRCTATNQAASLTLRKVVENVNGGRAVPADWSLTATPTGTFPAGLPPVTVTGSTTGTAGLVRPGVAYALSESGPAGYERVSLACTSVENRVGDTVTVPPLGEAVCTFTNRDRPATLTLIKDVVNDNGGTAARQDWTLTAAGATTTITGTSGAPAVTNASVPSGSYTLSESGGPAGYVASGWACTGGTVDGTRVSIAPGGVATCRITNTDTPARLTLLKRVENTHGGAATASDWTLSAAGPTPLSGVSETPAVSNVAVRAGAYTLSESAGPAGYEASAWSCTGGALAGARLTLTVGQSATCTITNRDTPARLTLVKRVDNAYGGTATETGWTLAAAGPTPISGTTGTAAVTGVEVNAGAYTLSESGGPGGYLASDWACTAGSLSGAVVTLAVGQSATCTVVNSDQPARLTLVKVVDGEEAGTGRVPSDWTLTATPDDIEGQDPVNGNGDPTTAGGVDRVEIFSGSYVLSESGPSGFDPGAWVCQGGVVDADRVTIASGGNAVCTITNTAVVPRLTLVKNLVLEHGGAAGAQDWTLSADGPTPIAGVTDSAAVTSAPVQVGAYDLTESGPPGYEFLGWRCVGGSLTGTTVTLAEGEDVTCTVTNRDLPARLTLIKAVVNDNGGTAAKTEWTLAADGPTPISGVVDTPPVTGAAVDAGTYDLAESGGPPGYTASGWSCVGGTQNGASVALDSGQSGVCTITNTDVPARLTLLKQVRNDWGGTADRTQWTLSAGGPTPLSGTHGSPGVTDVEVDAGTYTLTESGGPAGYTASDWTCTGDGTLEGDQLVLGLGEEAECTITNSDIPPRLTLQKQVVNTWNGPGERTDWTLSATGDEQGVSGVTDTDAVTSVAVRAGDYDLSESGGPEGYVAGDWTCQGGALDGATVTLSIGQAATCGVVNRDQPAVLTLVKKVVNDGGGSAAARDWTLSATAGETVVEGVTDTAAVTDVPVPAGAYTLAENGGPDGYTAGEWQCDGGSLEDDQLTLKITESARCTIVNDDNPATLTLVKEVVNEWGGAAQPGDWALSADGPTPLSGATGSEEVTDVAVDAGAYELSESGGPQGYAADDWTCEGGALDASTLTLRLGDSATCTVINRDQPARLTLVKEVVNDWDSSGRPADWTLTATADGRSVSGATGSEGVTGARVAAGAYTLTEKGPDGYLAGEWSCEGGSLDGAVVTVVNGGSATCTIVNRDQPEDPTVSKRVRSATDDGGGRWTVRYDLVVRNEDTVGIGASTVYGLADALFFGTGIVVRDASVTGPQGVTVNDGWDGVDDTVVAADVPLAAGAEHVFAVTVRATVPGTLTVAAGDCTVAGSEEGTGLLNLAAVEGPNGGSGADACAPVRPPGAAPPPTSPTEGPPLALTGLEVGSLLAAGVLLVGLGGAATVASRRRRTSGQG
ncbi:MAG TPA: VWA domain-containing protein [Dermatophilaceae bacterium]|nr:VWA domain-containing protein [Dermatophilaceae bacterium]